jgi:hypothetical protein
MKANTAQVRRRRGISNQYSIHSLDNFRNSSTQPITASNFDYNLSGVCSFQCILALICTKVAVLQ